MPYVDCGTGLALLRVTQSQIVKLRGLKHPPRDRMNLHDEPISNNVEITLLIGVTIALSLLGRKNPG